MTSSSDSGRSVCQAVAVVSGSRRVRQGAAGVIGADVERRPLSAGLDSGPQFGGDLGRVGPDPPGREVHHDDALGAHPRAQRRADARKYHHYDEDQLSGRNMRLLDSTGRLCRLAVIGLHAGGYSGEGNGRGTWHHPAGRLEAAMSTGVGRRQFVDTGRGRR